MQDFDLSITICSWNTIDDLRACLQSLRDAKDEAYFEVIVVDNGSSDGSAEMTKSEFPEFRLLAQKVNLGFTGGHNLAIEQSKGKIITLLNSDTVVHPEAIGKMHRFMTDHPDVGIAGPKLLNPDGSLQYSCRRFPNPIASAFRNTILGKIFPNVKFTRDYLMQDWDHAETREVDWVSGAALFARREFVEKVGPLDNNLFMYCEDVDWCKRAWDAGFKVMYHPDAVITHAIGRSTDKVANKMIVRFHRSMFRYYKKHSVKESPVLLRPILIVLAAIALFLRASAFLIQNGLDSLKRWAKR